MNLRYIRSLQAVRLRLDKRDELDYARLTWLQAYEGTILMPVHAEDLSNPRTDVFYSVAGMIRLDKRLRSKLSCVQYRSLLESLYDAMELCVSAKIPQGSVCFDSEFVYVDASDRLRFAVLPLAGATASRTPLELLTLLGEGGPVRFVLDDDARHARALADFCRRSTVLQPHEYGAFLSQEFGVPPSGWRASGAGERRTSPIGATGRVTGAGQLTTGRAASVFDPVALMMGTADQAPDASSRDIAGDIAAPEPAVVSAAPASEPLHAETGTVLLGRARPAARELENARPGASASDRRFCLLCMRTGRRVPVPEGEVVLGRSTTCDITIPDNSNISRRHAALRVASDAARNAVAIELRDLGSANGTRVAGEHLVPGRAIPLAPETVFYLADEPCMVTLCAD